MPCYVSSGPCWRPRMQSLQSPGSTQVFRAQPIHLVDEHAIHLATSICSSSRSNGRKSGQERRFDRPSQRRRQPSTIWRSAHRSYRSEPVAINFNGDRALQHCHGDNHPYLVLLLEEYSFHTKKRTLRHTDALAFTQIRTRHRRKSRTKSSANRLNFFIGNWRGFVAEAQD